MKHKTDSRKPWRPATLDLYTVAETAAILNVSKKTVYAWIKEKALKVVHLGPSKKLTRIRRVDLERFIGGDFGAGCEEMKRSD